MLLYFYTYAFMGVCLVKINFPFSASHHQETIRNKLNPKV